MTDNHGYKTPTPGTTDWHVPLNENFASLDTDIEIRDTADNRSNYEPKDGAKFLETDTGRAYIGAGTQWLLVPTTGPRPYLDAFHVGRFFTFATDYDSKQTRYESHIIENIDAVVETEENGSKIRNAPNFTRGYYPYVYADVVGATIAGGGRLTDLDGDTKNQTNSVFDNYTTISGGLDNTTSGVASTIAGGRSNETRAENATVGGGRDNQADGDAATVPGGEGNAATGPHSFAAGESATASNGNTFVWNDGSDPDFESADSKQFLVNATGGVGLGTNDPTAPLDVAGENNWDLDTTDGDVRIGDDTYRLAIGVSLGGAGAGTARLRAKGTDGNHRLKLGAGTTDTTTITESAVKPTDDGSASLGTSGKRWSSVYAQSGTVSTSDARLKTDVEDVGDGLDRVRDLQPVSYRWDETNDDAPDDDQQRLGFLAQDLADVVPEAVDVPDDDGYYGVNYDALVPVLTDAVQSQQETIEDQQAALEAKDERIDSLESDVETLREELATMKQAVVDGGML